jgi:uncharacterized protein YxeA
MKKIVIIAAIVLTTCVTAFALTNKENKTDKVKFKTETTAGKETTSSANATLATAD